MNATARLIRDNANAPADRLIRALYAEFANIRDDINPDTPIPTADDALDLWYQCDVLTLVFDRPGTEPERRKSDGFVHLIHQQSTGRPSLEDVSDFSSWMLDIDADRYPRTAEAMNPDSYPAYFH